MQTSVLFFSPEQTSGLVGFLNIFRQTSDLHVSILFLTPPKLQTSDLERSEQNCHFKSDNYIIICTENAHARELTGGAFSIHQELSQFLFFRHKFFDGFQQILCFNEILKFTFTPLYFTSVVILFS